MESEPTFAARYRRLFSIDEIEQSAVLQSFLLVLLVGFLLTLVAWYDDPWLTTQAVESTRARCWPYFQGCTSLNILDEPRAGYSQTIMYAVLFAVLVGAGAAAIRKRFVLAHALTLVLVLWKLLVYFVLTNLFATNYHYFHLVFCVVFLAVPLKTIVLRRTVVVLYFLAASVKLHEGWILGTYFTSMHLGLPLVPDALVPIATNLVILLETIGSPLLLSSRPRIARAAFWAFVAFHLYSVAIVGIQFSVACLLPLIALFGPRDAAPARVPFDRVASHAGGLWRRAIAGWVILVGLFAVQSIGLLIPGDSRITGEGSNYGLSMFDANHQCQWDITLDRSRTGPRTIHNDTSQARRRCDPYREWFWIHSVCEKGRKNPPRITWTYDHSINGGPFYRIIDETDACKLDYRAFGHNAWIHSPDDPAANVPIVGYPVENDFD